MLIRIFAGLLLALLLWRLFRFAMGLRFAKAAREQARTREEAGGSRVVAELPEGQGMSFFVEDADAFRWGQRRVAKASVAGARVLLNGGVIGSFSVGGAALPEPPPAEAYEGRERWDVAVYLSQGGCENVHCGTLREGVSREIAARVFAALRDAAVDPAAAPRTAEQVS